MEEKLWSEDKVLRADEREHRYVVEEDDVTGEQHWYTDEEMTIRHRHNGPAIRMPDGRIQFWVMGTLCETFDQYKQMIVDLRCIDKIHEG